MAKLETGDRKIGLGGAVVTMIGLVVGASIFSLPGALAASAGPAVVISYLIASIVALFSCLVAARIGTLFPVSGASYVAISKMLSPFFGFLGVWLVLLSAAIGVAFLAYVFADYAALVLEADLDRRMVAIGVVVLFGSLNAISTRAAVFGQSLMVVAFMLALVVFCVAGIGGIDTGLLRPFIPNGMAPVIYAAIPAFFSFTGFMMIVELSGEIRNPDKVIPQALFVSFGVVLFIYAAVSFAIVGNIHWSELAEIEAPVGQVAMRILPGWAANFIAITALAAAATSVNGILLGYSRDVLVLAQANLFPQFLARKSARGGDPVNAVLLIAAVSLLCVMVGGKITDYASILVLAIMLLQILLGLSLWQSQRKMPDEFKELKQLYGRHEIKVSSAGLILSSAVFVCVGFISAPATGLFAIAYTAAGAVFYYFRTRSLSRKTDTL